METKFYRYVASAFPILWVDTSEYDRAITQLTKEVTDKLVKITNQPFKFFSWDIDRGIINLENNSQVSGMKNSNQPGSPISFIRDRSEKSNIIFAKHFHHYLNKPQIWCQLLNGITKMRKKGNIFVIVSPVINIPIEIEKYVNVINFDLPNRTELMGIVNKFESDFIKGDLKKITEKEKEDIIDHGLGLSAAEFENAFSLGLSNPHANKAQVIYEQKKQLIIKTGLLKIQQAKENFKTLIGMDNMKNFTVGMINSKIGRGILIVGIQGAGKSEFAKRLGNETSRPVIRLDFGDLMNSYVGKTEEKTRNALKTVDAMEPAILFVDEFEKGLAGVSGGNGDSGVAMRQGQKFLTWLSDHETDVFVVATANDISQLPPEYLRAERWDAIFFVDFPTEEQSAEIFKVYKKKYGLKGTAKGINFKEWTGAEIKTLCRISSALSIDITEARKYVTNIINVDKQKITRLQSWADGRAIPANIIKIDEEDGLNSNMGNIIVTD